MKTRLIEAIFDTNTGTSYVKISTKYGVFDAYAHCANQDKPYMSRYFGCQIAEFKCKIKAYKARKKILEIKLTEARHISHNYNEACFNNIDNRVRKLKQLILDADFAIEHYNKCIEQDIEQYFANKK